MKTTNKTKKPKYVYHSSEIPHLWANQSLEKAGSPLKQPGGWHGGPLYPYRQIYFEGTTIWSYGSHYKLGEIITHKGVKVALINGEKSSKTTNEQRYDCYAACDDLMPVFYTDPDAGFDLKAAVLARQAELIDHLFNHFKSFRFSFYHIDTPENIQFNWGCDENTLKQFNHYCYLLGMPQFKLELTDEYIEMYFEHIQQRLDRVAFLQTPEQQALKEKRQEQKRQSELVKHADIIEQWRNGTLPTSSLPLVVRNQTLLRINGDSVETSRGARVPLTAARALYMRVINNSDVSDQRIGHYTVKNLTPDKAFIRIGCHTISISEASLLFNK